MKAAVIRFPGSNCDRDALDATRRAGFESFYVWHQETELPPADLIVIPGGFSYGDYLRAGAMAARAPIMPAVAKAAKAGAPTVGVCNGFQILCELGLLPGALVRNQGMHFVCRLEALRVETTASPFTRGYARAQIVRFVTSHGEGCFAADDDALRRLEDEDRVAFRYLDNPNGSQNDIAGVLSPNRRVLGLMPHPDRAVDADTAGGADGLAFFQGAMETVSA